MTVDPRIVTRKSYYSGDKLRVNSQLIDTNSTYRTTSSIAPTTMPSKDSLNNYLREADNFFSLNTTIFGLSVVSL